MANLKRSLPVVTNCDNCGACCTEQGGLPVSWYLGCIPFGDPESLPAEVLEGLRAILAEFMAGNFPPDGSPCVWFDADTRRCKHYEHRPDTCRDENVTPGNDACLRWRRLKGIDKGRTTHD